METDDVRYGLAPDRSGSRPHAGCGVSLTSSDRRLSCHTAPYWVQRMLLDITDQNNATVLNSVNRIYEVGLYLFTSLIYLVHENL